MSGQQPLEALEKKQFCQLKEANPKLSYKDLIAKAKEKFNKTPSDSQIARMLKRKGEYLNLIMDNAPSHKLGEHMAVHGEYEGLPYMDLDNITILFLPPNTTSLIQPLDAGIIANFKLHYRRMCLDWLLPKVQAGSTEDLSKVVPNVLQVVNLIPPPSTHTPFQEEI
jgi:hypothetical protein